jgi:hypothetical protein
MGLQTLENKVLSRGIIGKSAPILAEITIRKSQVCTKRADTVGQPPSTEIGVLNMPSWKAKKLGKRPQEKVLLEL